MSILTLFCEIDDFFLMSEAHLLNHCRFPSEAAAETRGRPRGLHPNEVITILIAFHQRRYRTFKHFYQKHVCVYWQTEFHDLVSYSRFVQLKKGGFSVINDAIKVPCNPLGTSLLDYHKV